MNISYDKTHTVGTIDRWLAYLIENEATPLLLWGRSEDGGLIHCFDQELRDMPFKDALELLMGLEGSEEDKI